MRKPRANFILAYFTSRPLIGREGGYYYVRLRKWSQYRKIFRTTNDPDQKKTNGMEEKRNDMKIKIQANHLRVGSVKWRTYTSPAANPRRWELFTLISCDEWPANSPQESIANCRSDLVNSEPTQPPWTGVTSVNLSILKYGTSGYLRRITMTGEWRDYIASWTLINNYIMSSRFLRGDSWWGRRPNQLSPHRNRERII